MGIFSAGIFRVLRLKRECPRCKRGQVVPGSKRKETVRCKFCGADIPPRK